MQNIMLKMFKYLFLCWLVHTSILAGFWNGGGTAPSSMVVQAMDWSDVRETLWGVITTMQSSETTKMEGMVETLTMEQVMQMRVRDIKWRLARQHGFSAEELGRMIDKKELIQALAFGEEKDRLKAVEDWQRTVLHRGMIWTLVVIVITILWPVIRQGLDIALVNFSVYKDRKLYEARRCRELKSPMAIVGISFMFILDLLQAWLYISVLLSWFISRNQYFFPIPNIPIRPAELIGGETKKAFGGYGINIGSMVITWGLRFVHSSAEAWTGKVMLQAQKKLRKESKQQSTGKNKNKTKSSTLSSEFCGPNEQLIFRNSNCSNQENTRSSNLPPSSLPDQWMEPTIFQDGLFPVDESSSPGEHTGPLFASTQQPAFRSGANVNRPSSVPITDSHLQFLDQIQNTDDNVHDDDDADWDNVMGELD